MPLLESYIRERIGSVKHWYHQIEIRPGIVTPGINDTQEHLRMLNIPENCQGLRVLDLGTRDGFFAFEFEKRGAAEVVAIDYLPRHKTGFSVAAELLDSQVIYHQDNIYNVSSQKYGRFDVVLMLGLLYHLRDPMQALDIARDVCTNEFYVETQVIDNAFLLTDGRVVLLDEVAPQLSTIPLMQFYPRDSLNNDATNYWAPNAACMASMLEESNFNVVEHRLFGQRAAFKCHIANDATIEYQTKIARGIAFPEVGE